MLHKFFLQYLSGIYAKCCRTVVGISSTSSTERVLITPAWLSSGVSTFLLTSLTRLGVQKSKILLFPFVFFSSAMLSRTFLPNAWNCNIWVTFAAGRLVKCGSRLCRTCHVIVEDAVEDISRPSVMLSSLCSSNIRSFMLFIRESSLRSRHGLFRVTFSSSISCFGSLSDSEDPSFLLRNSDVCGTISNKWPLRRF